MLRLPDADDVQIIACARVTEIGRSTLGSSYTALEDCGIIVQNA